tara:strand:- start:346 stop:729 length:384 start_codon:yes stop_codon:yes gene_type:complete
MRWIDNIYKTFIKNTNNKLFVGVHNDKTAHNYKRFPIMTMKERILTLSYNPYIDKIIPNAPINVSKKYINKHKLDIICIPNNRTNEEIKYMYEIPFELNMIRKLDYTDTISTSEIIQRIKNRTDLDS